MSVCYTQIASPLGLLLIAGDDAGLRHIIFTSEAQPQRSDPAWREDAAPLTETIRQLQDGARPDQIVASWSADLATFEPLRRKYFLYK